MKELNRKGFTLVELLGVVVILSIVVGVSIPIANNIISKSRYRALGSIVDEAEDFISDQWKLKKYSPDTMNGEFKDIVDNLQTNEFLPLNVTDNKEIIEAMGISTNDVTSVKVMVDSDGIPCVVITEIPENSKLFNPTYWTKVNNKIIPVDADNYSYYSKCCDPILAQGALEG